MPLLPFDKVIVGDPAGQRVLSVEEYFALPLSERVRIVLERKIDFSNQGTLVNRSEALKALRVQSALL